MLVFIIIDGKQQKYLGRIVFGKLYVFIISYEMWIWLLRWSTYGRTNFREMNLYRFYR